MVLRIAGLMSLQDIIDVPRTSCGHEATKSKFGQNLTFTRHVQYLLLDVIDLLVVSAALPASVE